MKSARKRLSQRGFSLIEALASVVLVTIGIVATMMSLGAFARSETRALEAEEMQRLALRKYEEIVAIGALPAGEASGDFADVGQPQYDWTAVRSPTGTRNLDNIRVDVSRRGNDPRQRTEVQGFYCRPAPDKGTP